MCNRIAVTFLSRVLSMTDGMANGTLNLNGASQDCAPMAHIITTSKIIFAAISLVWESFFWIIHELGQSLAELWWPVLRVVFVYCYLGFDNVRRNMNLPCSTYFPRSNSLSGPVLRAAPNFGSFDNGETLVLYEHLSLSQQIWNFSPLSKDTSPILFSNNLLQAPCTRQIIHPIFFYQLSQHVRFMLRDQIARSKISAAG